MISWLRRLVAPAEGRSAYAAGRNPPGRAPWVAPAGNAMRATAGSTRRIADRARDAVRNNPYAARILDVWVGQAVADGVTTRWSDPAHADLWERWSSSLACDATRGGNWGSLQALAMRSTVESGEAICRLRTIRPTFDNPVGLELLLSEGDVLDESRHGLHEGNRLVQGVEVDSRGRPVAYWLLPDYEAWPWGVPTLKSERVPAANVAHMFRRRRPGQVRDVSWLAPILWPLRDLGQYEAALLRKAEIEACLAAIVTDDTQETLSDGGRLVTDAHGNVIEEIQPGMILYRRGSGGVEMVNPSTGGSHLGFAKRTLEAAAVGTGLTYDQISGDLTGANYSSLRAGKIEFNRLVGQVQYTMLIPLLVDRVAQRFHEQGVLLGLWPADSGARTHVPPAPEMIDPLKDTNALITQVRAGFKSQPEAVASFGYAFEAVLDDIRKANAALDAAGVILDTDPRRTTGSGGVHDAAQAAAVQLAAGRGPRAPQDVQD